MVKRKSPTSPLLPSAVGYVRVSSDIQVAEGVSLEAQRQKISAWASAHGYQLVQVFEDAGISGFKTHNRPGLQLALDLTCSQKAALVVYSLSRLARSTKDALSISEVLDKAGADLVSISENLDTTSAAGKLIFRLLAVLAEFERDQVSERTALAMRYMRSQLKRVGAIPFGFDLAEDGESLVPNEQELEMLDLIQALRKKGASLRAIGMELQRRGVRTKTGNEVWAPQVVKELLERDPLPASVGSSR